VAIETPKLKALIGFYADPSAVTGVMMQMVLQHPDLTDIFIRGDIEHASAMVIHRKTDGMQDWPAGLLVMHLQPDGKLEQPLAQVSHNGTTLWQMGAQIGWLNPPTVTERIEVVDKSKGDDVDNDPDHWD